MRDSLFQQSTVYTVYVKNVFDSLTSLFGPCF